MGPTEVTNNTYLCFQGEAATKLRFILNLFIFVALICSIYFISNFKLALPYVRISVTILVNDFMLLTLITQLSVIRKFTPWWQSKTLSENLLFEEKICLEGRGLKLEEKENPKMNFLKKNAV